MRILFLFLIATTIKANSQNGVLVTIYDSKDLSGEPVFETVSPTFNYFYASGIDPITGVEVVDTLGLGRSIDYSTRIEGQILAKYTEKYTLYFTHNDGDSLWINGELMHSNWIDGVTTETITLDMVAGKKYDLLVYIYQGAGSSKGVLEWESASQAREVVPTDNLYAISEKGLWVTIYDSKDLSGELVFETVSPTFNYFYASGIDPITGVEVVDTLGLGRATDYSTRIEGRILAKYTEKYTLYFTHNDGDSIWINGELMHSNWIDGVTTETITLDMVAGKKYDLLAYIYQGAGSSKGVLEWESPSQTREVIPQSNLTAVRVAHPITLDVKITGLKVNAAGNATTITTKGGKLQMNCSVLPGNAADKTFTWSVSNGSGEATISAGGLLVAVKDGTVTVRATANDGSGVFGELVITISGQSSTSIKQVQNEIRVYPNPIIDAFQVYTSDIINDLCVYSGNGQLIYSEKINSNFATVNCSNWKRGIYFIKTETNKGVISQKMIK
jgi:hypothetical protein